MAHSEKLASVPAAIQGHREGLHPLAGVQDLRSVGIRHAEILQGAAARAVNR